MNRRWQLKRTTLISMSLGAFLLGLGFARLGTSFSAGWLVAASILLLVTVPRKRIAGVITIVLFGFLIGWWRGYSFSQKLWPYESLSGQKIIVRATAQTDGFYGDNGQLEFDASGVKIFKPFTVTVPGKIKVAGFGTTAIYRGDIFEAEGKLFPTRGSRQGSISYAELAVLGRSNNPIDTLRRRFSAGMASALPEPHASLSLGLLIGERNTLPDVITSELSAVGLTHIIAVSGYNLTIIIQAVKRFGKKRSKYQFTLFSLALIFGFLLLTGFSASIVRAAIVSSLSLLAWYYGRVFRPILLILLGAALTASWYPLYLWSDIGWYLSFFAFFGVLIVAPIISARFSKHEPKLIGSVMLESFCAQLMTAPFVIYIFQQTSPVALISNLVIVPLVPLAMLLGLIAGLAGMVIPILAGYLSWPAKLLLTYILDMVHIFSRVPHALVKVSVSLSVMLLMYLIVVILSIILWQKTLKSAKITDIETDV